MGRDAAESDCAVPRGKVPAYLHGRTEFTGLFADLAKGKRNWQLAAFLALSGNVVLGLGLASVSLTSRIQPYVVEVDQLGRAQAFGPATALKATDRRVVLSQVASFIHDIRTVIADPVAQAELVRRSYAFVDQDAAEFLNAFFGDPRNDPRVLGRDITRLVEVTSVLAVPGAPSGSETWKVTWTETNLARGSGSPATATAWEAYLTTRTISPSKADARMMLNPLGLYVSSISWTQVGGAPVTPVAAAVTSPTALTPNAAPLPIQEPARRAEAAPSPSNPSH